MEDLTELIIYSNSGNTVKIDWGVYGGHKYEQHREEIYKRSGIIPNVYMSQLYLEILQVIATKLFLYQSVYSPAIK